LQVNIPAITEAALTAAYNGPDQPTLELAPARYNFMLTEERPRMEFNRNF
jgi:hypothetical protein